MSPPPNNPQVAAGHSHIHSLGGYVSSPTSGVLSMAPSRQPLMQRLGMGLNIAPPAPILTVGEELREEMTTLHLGYIETEDSPRKMEQREKLEGMELVNILC